MPDENNNQKKPFKVTISDEDYLKPDELDALLSQSELTVPQFNSNSKPKFEVHLDEDGDSLPVQDESPLEYKGEIYFSNAKPVRTNNVNAQNVKKKGKKNSSYGALTLFLAVMIICASVVSAYGISCINDILAFNRSEDTVTVTIPLDATTNEIIDILADEGLVKQKTFCKLFYQLETVLKGKSSGSSSDPVYLSGVYYVEKNDGLESYLYQFRETQTGQETTTVSIPEGWTVYQIFDRLEKFGVCSKSRLLSSISGTTYEYDFIKNIPDNSYRTQKLEGYLYPNTYEFYVDSDPNSVIRKFLDEFELKWTDEYQKRADELGYTMDEIITIASIIQREAANTDQMADISSVIHNRLKHSASWPTLDCDSTETFVKNYVSENVTATQAQIYAQKYNTYNNQGLPPGPICSPGDDAIHAALYPNDTSYYFFRHDKKGNIYLAKTQAEHDANANLVLRANSK